MNVAAMAVITLLIFAEKSLPVGRRVAQAAAAALVVYGALVVFLPQLLPTPSGWRRHVRRSLDGQSHGANYGWTHTGSER